MHSPSHLFYYYYYFNFNDAPNQITEIIKIVIIINNTKILNHILHSITNTYSKKKMHYEIICGVNYGLKYSISNFDHLIFDSRFSRLKAASNPKVLNPKVMTYNQYSTDSSFQYR